MTPTATATPYNLSPKLLEDLKEISRLFEKDVVDHCSATLAANFESQSDMPHKQVDRFAKKFPAVLRGLLKISTNLASAREIRDIFADVLEEVVERIRKIELTDKQVERLLDMLLDLNHLKGRLERAWHSFMTPMRLIIMQIYLASQPS